MLSNPVKMTKPSYGSGHGTDSTNSASYSGYGIAKSNKYGVSDVSILYFLWLISFLFLGFNKNTCSRGKQSDGHSIRFDLDTFQQ